MTRHRNVLSPREAGREGVHRQVRDALWLALPVRALAWHTPNGVRLRGTPAERAAEWARMEELGAIPGFPDYAIACDGRLRTLEIKSEDGREADRQAEVAVRLRAAGVAHAVVRSAPEALAALEADGLDLRPCDFGDRAFPSPGGGVPGWRLLYDDWCRAAQAAVEAWASLVIGAPRQVLFDELAGHESRLRQLAILATTSNDGKHSDAPPATGR